MFFSCKKQIMYSKNKIIFKFKKLKKIQKIIINWNMKNKLYTIKKYSIYHKLVLNYYI